MRNSRQIIGTILAAALAGGASSCVTDPSLDPGWGMDDHARADEWGPSSGVDLVDAEPRPGETVTQARARALTEYGEALIEAWDPALDASFARRGVEGQLLSEAYGFRVEGGSCFSEDERWGSDYDIATDDDLVKMRRQVDFAVEFVARFHEDANGYPNRFFDTVALCPDGQIGGSLVLQGRVLYVGVEYWFGAIYPSDAFEIREAWAEGEHLEAYYPTLSNVWFLLDPVGTPRTVLRDAVGDAAEYVGERLSEMRDQPDNRLRADLLDLVEDSVIAEYEPTEGEPLSESAAADIETMTDPQLRELVDLWQGFVTDQGHWEGMTEAVLATHQATARSSYDIDVEQWGLVVVGNFHNITVDISAFLPRNREFVRYVQIQQVPQSVRVRQYGLVAVYTIDNVEVNLAVTADRGLETAGLEHALDRVTR